MDELIIGYDENIGLPQDFKDTINLQQKCYPNAGLTQMLQDFDAAKISLAFLPAGTLPYLKSTYEVVAQAALGPQYSNHMVTQLVTAKKISLPQALASKLGRVNCYCTTSFWAPLIYIMCHFANDNSVQFINTNSFQDMLFKVADQKIDSAMVWDSVLQEHPQAAGKVEALAVQDDLPTPIIIANRNIPEDLKGTLTHFKSNDKNSYFSGYIAPDLNLINHFKHQMMQANKHFNLGIQFVS